MDNFAKLYLDPQSEMPSSREMRDGMEVLFNLFFKWFLLLLKSWLLPKIFICDAQKP